MGNIIGNNPRKWAANQVNLRQQLLGLQNRPANVLAWQTNNTAWIRAISAVKIDEEKSKELTGSESYVGGKLAKEYVLFNGTTSTETTEDGNQTFTQKSGVLNQAYSSINNNAYGFGSTSERGLVPMPGVESLDITTYNRGSLRRASFKLKAYSREQFAIIDALFMRPGYTLLLEWGHTTYFKGTPENPQYTTANFNTEAFNLLNKFLDGNSGDLTQDSILKAIVKERGDGRIVEEGNSTESGSEGNYDGFYGKITNFVWNYNSDGSYDIEVKAISTGDIIESLTINRVEPPENVPQKKQNNTSNNPTYYYFNLTDDKGSYTRRVPDSKKQQYREWWADPSGGGLTDSDNNGLFDNVGGDFNTFKAKYPSTMNKFTLKRPADSLSPEDEGPDVLLANKDRTDFNGFLYKQYNWLKTNISKLGTELKTTNNSSSPTIKVLSTLDQESDPSEGSNADLIMIQPLVTRDLIDGSSGEVKGQVTRLSQNAPFQYITLRRLLDYIEGNLLVYNGGEQTGETEKPNDPQPIITFDDTEIYCYTQPEQFSADPNVCIIPFTFEGVTYFEEVIGPEFRDTGSPFVGNLLDIPVNLHYIGSTLKQCTQNNAVPLLRFLEQLLYGIQESLGSINKFSVTYDHDNNQIIIRDDVPLDPKVATKTIVPIEDRTLFNVNGWKPTQQNGSFVTNVGISTTLSNQFATMISIGAQSRSESDVANSTSFSRWNVGLIDSVTPSKLSKKAIQQSKAEAKNPSVVFNKTVESLLKNGNIIKDFYTNKKSPSGEVISTARSQNAAVQQYKAQVNNPESPKPSTQGFIPFSMNLDMDGFSGLRIYEKFYITTEILPKSYPDTLSFLCKGINHSISTSGWKTKIDSLTITSVDDPKSPVLTTPNNTINFNQ